MKKALLDLDGVCCSSIETTYKITAGVLKIDLALEEVMHCYNINDWTKLSLEAREYFIKLINDSMIYDFCDPYEDALEVIAYLKSRPDIDFNIYTQAINPEVTQGKYQFCKHHFGLEPYIIVGRDKPYIPCDLFVEDNPKNLEVETHNKLMLRNQPWNKQENCNIGIIRINSLHEVLEHII